MIGAGGVGAAMASVAQRRDFFERLVLADVDASRAEVAAGHTGDPRIGGAVVDASDAASIVELARPERIDSIVNAVDPRFNPAIFQAAFDAGCRYPATLGDRMRGLTCAGTFVTGAGKDGRPRSTYLYHGLDNEHAMREWGHQAVVLQTALNPVAALELLASGSWKGTGVLGPEAFPPRPFLDLLSEYGAPHGVEDR